VDNRRRHAAFDGHYRRGGAAEASGLTFLQISDSHVGFDKPANPNASARSRKRSQDQGSSREAILHHSYRRYHPSLQAVEFDDADRIISQARLDVHYVPGNMTSSTGT